MDDLGIKERTFYYYKEKIYQLSAEIQSKKNTAEVLAFEMQILKDRLSRMHRHLDERITATENMRARDLVIIVPVACDIAKAIFQLEKEGLSALSGINKRLLNNDNKIAAQQQQKISQN